MANDNAVIKSIEMEEENNENGDIQNNSFQEAVKELGEILFEKYPEKTSNLSDENINGMIVAECLNEYMAVNFKYDSQVLKMLVDRKQIRVVSKNGFGVEKIIEFVKSIQATFEQTQLPERLASMMRR